MRQHLILSFDDLCRGHSIVAVPFTLSLVLLGLTESMPMGSVRCQVCESHSMGTAMLDLLTLVGTVPSVRY